MRKRLIAGILIVCMLLVMSPVMAQSPTGESKEIQTRNELTGQAGQLQTLIMEPKPGHSSQLTTYLTAVQSDIQSLLSAAAISPEEGDTMKKKAAYAIRLAQDAALSGRGALWANAPFLLYDVQAISPIKRLPDMLPEDGTISNRLSMISAQGEYEAVSFVLAPLSDVNAVTFTASDLTGSGGSIPASAIDLRVVKTWYQGGTAWASYFADPSASVLTPELLLHDEKLIQVDHQRKGNSLRIDYPSGSQYVDISNTPASPFNRYNEPVEDSPVLLPIELKQGESKQMWLTLKVPSEAAAGIYEGSIAITADGQPAGQLALIVRVLPFELPDPKTYYDLNKDFYAMLYHQSRLKEQTAAAGGNTALVETVLLNEYRNLAEHNFVNIPGPLYASNTKAIFIRQLELMQQAGLKLDPLFGVRQAHPEYSVFVQYNNYLNAKKVYEANPTPANKQKMDNYYNGWRQGVDSFLPTLDEAFQVASEFVGHTNLFFDGWDEAGWSMLQFEQEIWKYIQEQLGGKVFATGHASHLDLEVKENYLNWVGLPERERAAQWHAFGDDKMITNYAMPHTGPENPDLMRQRHGMWPYKANYDATYNYIFYENPTNIWNDNASSDFRAFNLVYPTKTKLIDTIAWEGMREGIDDIRYATMLKQTAAEAIASGDPARSAAANAALDWLEAVDERSINQDLLRLEMIQRILALLDLQ
ncbi:hypothetical protein [Paenibacillus sp. GCM10027626]|uniref:hypothetical protein n=1 Tax=Paenibacillus sp. GCM10027626 TaxID=3273411 RepID=UPI003642FFAF